MQRSVLITGDGSPTIYVKELDETYHSRYGSVQESLHVFIREGLEPFRAHSSLNILEIGMGTGLNLLLTALLQKELRIHYDTLEPYPLQEPEWSALHYSVDGSKAERELYKMIHRAPWEAAFRLQKGLEVKKLKTSLQEFTPDKKYDLVYFDAFSPDKQPELWEERIFQKLFNCMNSGARLTTYSSKGQVRRNMQSAGFRVNRVRGPKGKLEMLVAVR